jgi:dye decolorizing peroxidase
MRHDRLEERWSGGDLVLLVGGSDGTTVAHAVRRLVADARPFATLRWRQPGFWNGVDEHGRPMTGRNLFGQVDGSGNPREALRDLTVWIGDGPWAGGTTLVLRRIRLDVDTWDRLTRDQQEAAMGRRLDTGAPLSGGTELDRLDLDAEVDGRPVIAADAHARRANPAVNGGARILRKGANYVREVSGPAGLRVEHGLLFMSFQADIGSQFVPIQRSLDESDALNVWTTAIGSASFAMLPGIAEGGWLGETVLA